MMRNVVLCVKARCCCIDVYRMYFDSMAACLNPPSSGKSECAHRGMEKPRPGHSPDIARPPPGYLVWISILGMKKPRPEYPPDNTPDTHGYSKIDSGLRKFVFLIHHGGQLWRLWIRVRGNVRRIPTGYQFLHFRVPAVPRPTEGEFTAFGKCKTCTACGRDAFPDTPRISPGYPPGYPRIFKN